MFELGKLTKHLVEVPVAPVEPPPPPEPAPRLPAPVVSAADAEALNSLERAWCASGAPADEAAYVAAWVRAHDPWTRFVAAWAHAYPREPEADDTWPDFRERENAKYFASGGSWRDGRDRVPRRVLESAAFWHTAGVLFDGLWDDGLGVSCWEFSLGSTSILWTMAHFLDGADNYPVQWWAEFYTPTGAGLGAAYFGNGKPMAWERSEVTPTAGGFPQSIHELRDAFLARYAAGLGKFAATPDGVHLHGADADSAAERDDCPVCLYRRSRRTGAPAFPDGPYWVGPRSRW